MKLTITCIVCDEEISQEASVPDVLDPERFALYALKEEWQHVAYEHHAKTYHEYRCPNCILLPEEERKMGRRLRNDLKMAAEAV